MTNHPRIGVGVIVKKDGKYLLGKRIGSHGANTWNFPGGHLEFGETPIDTALREVEEEAGITLKNLRTGPYTNDLFKVEDKHYVTIFVLADWESGEPKIMEPEKCLGWEWFSWDELPEPMFLPIENLLKTGYVPE